MNVDQAGIHPGSPDRLTFTGTSREAFLRNVRDAVLAYGRPGESVSHDRPALPRTQPSQEDRSARFTAQAAAAGTFVHAVNDAAETNREIMRILEGAGANRLLVGHGSLIDRLDMAAMLGAMGKQVGRPREIGAEAGRQAFFDADAGISEAYCLIAETGSVVLNSGPDEPRSLSLLPPLHIVIAETSRIVEDLFDLFSDSWLGGRKTKLPSCTALITGPSKTGDIELRLVTGVHGPGEVHVVLLRRESPST